MSRFSKTDILFLKALIVKLVIFLHPVKFKFLNTLGPEFKNTNAPSSEKLSVPDKSTYSSFRNLCTSFDKA
jgi:hypothetical protein